MTPAPDAAVVVAHDGSQQAHGAVDAVANLFPGRRVVVLTVWESATTQAPAHALVTETGVEAFAQVDRAEQELAAALAGDAAARLRDAGCDASVVTLGSHGNIAAAIVSYAERDDVAVVALGRRGQSQVKSVLLGSVSDAVVRRSTKPVLVVGDAGDA